jgi:HEAT repeat protein
MKRCYVLIIASFLIALCYSLSAYAEDPAQGAEMLPSESESLPVEGQPPEKELRPAEEQLQGVHAAKTVRIVVYLSGDSKNPSWLEDMARKFCEYAGLTVVSDDDVACDMALYIDAKAEAVFALYRIQAPFSSQEGEGGWDRAEPKAVILYSGAAVSGRISLKSGDANNNAKTFSGRVDPPAHIEWKSFRGAVTRIPEPLDLPDMVVGKVTDAPYPIASSAPFGEALENGSFVSKMFEVLGEISGPDLLISALRDEQWKVRRSAAERLGEIKDKRAVEPLIAALGDEIAWVRWQAAEALGEIGDERAIGPLVAALGDKDPLVRENAAKALEKIGKPSVLPLIAALGNEDSDVRYGAAEALGKIGDERAVEPLITALRDGDWLVRDYTATALGRIRDKRAVEPLIAVLGDSDSDVRREAAYALAKIGKPSVPPLIAALGNENADVRYGAAEALGDIGDKRAVEPLIAALEDEDVNVHLAVYHSLDEITGKQFEDQAKWQEWWDKNKEKIKSDNGEPGE